MNISYIEYLGKIKEYFEDEQKRSYAVFGVTLIAIVLYITFAIIPKVNEFTGDLRRVSDLNDKISLVNSRVKRLSQMNKRLTEMKKEHRSYAKLLPPQKDIPELLEKFASVAKKSNVTIESITPYEFVSTKSKKGDNRYYREMPILITAKSGYHQLGDFLSSLEQTNRFIAIEDLRIRYDSRTPRKHNVRMVLKTYVSVEDK